jgi:hypothetical protein
LYAVRTRFFLVDAVPFPDFLVDDGRLAPVISAENDDNVNM